MINQFIEELDFPSREVMVYGFESCQYKNVSSMLSRKGYRVHNAALGIMPGFTYQGWEIEKLPLELKSDKEICKAALVNLIFENYKRSKRNDPLIPLIFCLETNAHPFSIARAVERNEDIGNSELRRCYKLYQFIKPIAEKTFLFFNVSNTYDDIYLNQVCPIWERADWSESIQRRESTPNSNQRPKTRWQDVLQSAISRVKLRSNL
jgi:hypothetical protein